MPDGLGIVAAPGTQALIGWLPRLVSPGRPVSILGPTYAEHRLAWRAAGHDPQEVRELGRLPPGGHVVVVNPNNPDGRIVPPADLLRVAERCRRAGTCLVVDESFADVAPDASLVPSLADAPAIVLRSFGKFYGLAGLRLGFAIARPDIADGIARALGPWSVSGPALAAGRAALDDAAWADEMRARLAAETGELDDVLNGAGLRVVGGTNLFRLAEADGAKAVHAGLVRARVWVRRFAERPGVLRFGLPPDRAGLDRLRGALGRADRAG